jgi:nucleolar MIF4G domain-containing protein 1
MPLRATKNFTNKRSKSKKRKNGPQLPNYVQEQLLSRDAGIASGFENKDFLRLSLQDSNADGASDNGNKKNNNATITRKQKRKDEKDQKKMNKKRRFENMRKSRSSSGLDRNIYSTVVVGKTKNAREAESGEETRTKKMKRSDNDDEIRNNKNKEQTTTTTTTTTTIATVKEKKKKFSSSVSSLAALTSKENGKKKKKKVSGMRSSLLEAYKEDEFNAKRLEKKMGKKKIDDGLDLFMEGLPGLELLGGDDEFEDDEEEEEEMSVSEEDDDDDDETSDDEEDEVDDDNKRDKEIEAAHADFKPSTTKYVPPAQRAARKAAEEAQKKNDENNKKKSKKKSSTDDIDDPSFETQRRVIRGLLNRLGEANVANVVREISAIAREHPRKTVGDCVSYELVHKALAEGPKASDSYCAAIACLVAGCSGEIGPEFAARFGANTCERFELERQNEESSRPASNLALCLAKLYNVGLFPSSTIYGCLTSLAKTLSEMDAGLTLTILKISGGKLRGEDPAGMKSYIDALSETAQALKSSTNGGESGTGGLSKRARLTLELVLDLKNNKISKSDSDASGKDQFGIPIALSRWVKTANRVGEVTIALRSLTYDILIDDALDKTGNWWLPEAAGTEEWFKKRNAERMNNNTNEDFEGETHLLTLAKKMRMNTETRRAIFCVVMSSEDYADCLERLLKLPLSGQGDREIVRVILECCLQEKAFNPYYAILTSKLVERQKRHRLTLRLCIQDQLKEIKSGENEETSSVRRVANLAKFFAITIASGANGTNALRLLEMSEFENMNARVNLFNRLFCRALLEDRQRTAKIDLLFAKLREKKEYADLARDFTRSFVSREILKGVDDEASRKRISSRGLALKRVLSHGLAGDVGDKNRSFGLI